MGIGVTFPKLLMERCGFDAAGTQTAAIVAIAALWLYMFAIFGTIRKTAQE